MFMSIKLGGLGKVEIMWIKNRLIDDWKLFTCSREACKIVQHLIEQAGFKL